MSSSPHIFQLLSSIPSFVSDIPDIDLSLIDEEIKNVARKNTSLSFQDAVDHLSKACLDRAFLDPGWDLLAGRFQVYYLQSIVRPTFSEACKQASSVLKSEYVDFVQRFSTELNSMIVRERNRKFGGFGICTLMKSYLLRIRDVNDKSKLEIIEDPQYMYMRIAVALCFPDLIMIRQAYDAYSLWKCTQATPTMFNAAMKKEWQLSSCFLMNIEDNLTSISNGWRQKAIISKISGGIGCCMDELRHGPIGNSGDSRGLVPWIKIDNAIIKAVDQGGRREGAEAVYCSAEHCDFPVFINMKRQTGPEELRARDLFYGAMIPDLFMRRVEKDEMWSLFCPSVAKGLSKLWGLEYESLYLTLEAQKKYNMQLPAREIFRTMCESIIVSGAPYVCFSDNINRKTNHQHLGKIKNGNLCTEIYEYTGPNEIASCNLASISLPACVKVANSDRLTADTAKPDRLTADTPEGVHFDFEELERIARLVTHTVDHAIDRTYYPEEVPEIRQSNLNHRPMGIGVQGLADVFAMMGYPWESEDARRLNYQISECVYFSTLHESMLMAQKLQPYASFRDSPLSKGLLETDLWVQEEIWRRCPTPNSDGSIDIEELNTSIRTRYAKYARRSDSEWNELRNNIKKHGVRHSLRTCQMPTAGSAQIMSNTEAREPSENLIRRKVLSGTFDVTNKHMVRDLKAIGMWNISTITNIIENGGSIAKLDICHSLEVDRLTVDTHPHALELRGIAKLNERLTHLKKVYKTVYEISQRTLLQYSIDIGRFLDQAESKNLFLTNPTVNILTTYLFLAWEGGMKTGLYYLRQRQAVNPINAALESIGDGGNGGNSQNPQSDKIRKKIEDVSEKKDCVMCSS